MTTLFINVGKRHGVEKDALSELMTERAGVGNDDLGRVRVNDRHSFVGVPTDRADSVIAALVGAEVADVELVVERARS